MCARCSRRGVPSALANGPAELLNAVRRGRWCGRATQLSEDHIQWTFIDEVVAVRPKILAGRGRVGLRSKPAADPRNWSGALPAASSRWLHARSSCSVEARWRSTRGRQSTPRRFLACSRARCRPSHLPRQASGGRRAFILLLFVHRVTVSRRDCICSAALRAGSSGCSVTFEAHDTARARARLTAARLSRARRLPRAGPSSQLRPGHRVGWMFQPRHDRGLRCEPRRVRARRFTAISSGNRGWSGRCSISKRKRPA